MVSQRTRNVVWQGYLDVSRLGMYYEALANRYRWYYISQRAALLISVFCSVASTFAPLNYPPLVTFALVALTVILVAVDYTLDIAKKNAVLHQINVDVERLETRWEALWLRIDDADADESVIRAENVSLQESLTDTTKRCGEEGIPVSNKLNQKCMENAYEIIKSRYQYAQGE